MLLWRLLICQQVDFDEKSPLELLQLLNDVLAAMDSQMEADVREENDDARVARTMNFVNMLKFPFPDEGQRESCARGLAVGTFRVHVGLKRKEALEVGSMRSK